MNKESRVIAQNKKASHDYFIEDTYEAGLVLTGTEIKSIRRGRINLKDSYCQTRRGEMFVLDTSSYTHIFSSYLLRVHNQLHAFHILMNFQLTQEV